MVWIGDRGLLQISTYRSWFSLRKAGQGKEYITHLEWKVLRLAMHLSLGAPTSSQTSSSPHKSTHDGACLAAPPNSHHTVGSSHSPAEPYTLLHRAQRAHLEQPCLTDVIINVHVSLQVHRGAGRAFILTAVVFLLPNAYSQCVSEGC